ncbi:MAG: hypothetical protein ACK5AY_11135 [Bacteroidota bacterium]
MQAYLIRSSEYPVEKFWDVVNLLNSFPGPIQFRTVEDPVFVKDEDIKTVPFKKDDFETQVACESFVFSASLIEEIQYLSWERIFEKCSWFRLKYRLQEDDFCIFLTELSNDKNWFAAADPSSEKNLFVQTLFWDYFTGSDQRYPVAYHVVTVLLKILIFKDYSDLNQNWHKIPVGCMMDFCQDKKQVSLKLRTADICETCQNLITSRKIDQLLVQQVFNVMEGIRSQMSFKSRFVFNPLPPELHIHGQQKKFRFPDLGNLELHLNPLEKTVYLFFLEKTEGIELSRAQDYKQDFINIYNRLSNSGDKDTIERRIEDLVSPLSNSLSEKISRIRRKFVDALGMKISENYIISGENAGRKKIKLDRSRVIYHY